ncbi:uncharacterized protein LOC116304869 isoform X3 [Actinia tenebrosa]|uniref:Uncharacterized protein LOC116304869 isoform X3 n=1 Tax=Actinia tenebrosa TaxID=6105 RepID=A0A6P8IWV7_ACTTE|nr:uncharacterized protein LOC116304869 isoform X3 [Actinia tenebrosa]
MKFLLLCIFVLAPSAAVSKGKQGYTIMRKAQADGSPDIFWLPSTMCDDSDSQCKSFEESAFTSSGGTCECICPNGSATFGFHNGSWNCIDNKVFRKQADCKYRFEKERDDGDSIKVLSAGFPYVVYLPSGPCSISLFKSRYFQCNGIWTGLKSSIFMSLNISDNMTFHGHRNGSSRQYTLKVGNASSLTGRIVSLQFNCSEHSPSSSPCLLFKIAGTITCELRNLSGPISFTQSSTRRSYSSSFSQPSAKLTKSTVLLSHNEEWRNSGGVSPLETGTITAAVIIVVLVITITGVIIWKKKRGENVWCKERIATTVQIICFWLAKEESDEGEPTNDPIYDQPLQFRPIHAVTRGTTNNGCEDRDSRYVSNDQLNANFYRTDLQTAQQEEGHEQDNPRDSVVSAEKLLTERDGYLVPHLYTTQLKPN